MTAFLHSFLHPSLCCCCFLIFSLNCWGFNPGPETTSSESGCSMLIHKCRSLWTNSMETIPKEVPSSRVCQVGNPSHTGSHLCLGTTCWHDSVHFVLHCSKNRILFVPCGGFKLWDSNNPPTSSSFKNLEKPVCMTVLRFLLWSPFLSFLLFFLSLSSPPSLPSLLPSLLLFLPFPILLSSLTFLILFVHCSVGAGTQYLTHARQLTYF